MQNSYPRRVDICRISYEISNCKRKRIQNTMYVSLSIQHRLKFEQNHQKKQCTFLLFKKCQDTTIACKYIHKPQNHLGKYFFYFYDKNDLNLDFYLSICTFIHCNGKEVEICLNFYQSFCVHELDLFFVFAQSTQRNLYSLLFRKSSPNVQLQSKHNVHAIECWKYGKREWLQKVQCATKFI